MEKLKKLQSPFDSPDVPAVQASDKVEVFGFVSLVPFDPRFRVENGERGTVFFHEEHGVGGAEPTRLDY